MIAYYTLLLSLRTSIMIAYYTLLLSLRTSIMVTYLTAVPEDEYYARLLYCYP